MINGLCDVHNMKHRPGKHYSMNAICSSKAKPKNACFPHGIPGNQVLNETH